MEDLGGKRKRVRGGNFSLEECYKLLDLIRDHQEVVECKKTDAYTWKQKEDAWKLLETRFNCGSFVSRSVVQLRSKFETLKKDARKEAAAERRSLLMTGGGPKDDFKPNPLLAKVREMIALTSEGLPSTCDSDGQMGILIEDMAEGIIQDDFVIIQESDNEVNENFSDAIVMDATLQRVLNSVADAPCAETKDWGSYSAAMMKCPKNKLLNVTPECSVSSVKETTRDTTPSTKNNSSQVTDVRGRPMEDEESTCRALCERELHSLHRNVPALRRTDVDTAAIRAHYYPEGGWGWIICGAAFLVHVLAIGLQWSYGYLCLYADRHLGTNAVWLGPLSLGVSLMSSPIVVAVCRRKSTRLTAVLGGLVAALACLFASFATKLHQVVLSYGVVLGIGSGMVRESCLLMLGHYFKRRREFVEMVAMAGGGVGVALFSVVHREAIGKLGWRLGMQVVTLLVSLCFFLGLLYRSASLYHPQRRAILHLKNQRKKVKEKKTHQRLPKPPLLDISSLHCPAVRGLMLASAAAGAGAYAPLFYLASHGSAEGLEQGPIVLLQASLGLSLAGGCVLSGVAVCRKSSQCVVSRLYLCEASLAGVASLNRLCVDTELVFEPLRCGPLLGFCSLCIGAALLALSAVQGYHGLCLVAWLYGLSLGALMYSLKMLALERVRLRQFSRAWAFIQFAQAVPLMLGVYLTGELNLMTYRTGYYLSLSSIMLSAILLMFVRYSKRPIQSNSIISTLTNGDCICRTSSPPPFNSCMSNNYNNFSSSGCQFTNLSHQFSNGMQKSLSFASPSDFYEDFNNYNVYRPGISHYGHDRRVLRPSKSVPEGLGGPVSARHLHRGGSQRVRNVHLIEQITTSV